jgi:molecular chaperone GrpE
MTHSTDPALDPQQAQNPAAPQPANDAQPGPLPPADEAATRIAALETELAEVKDRLLRTAAETENVRRRLERERDEARVFAATRFAKDILSVADNLRRALDTAPNGADDVKAFIGGVEVTERELLSVFERHQIKRIDALGARFDPHLHEAVVEVEDPTKPAGTVVQVMMPGYTISGRLLRAAMVAVSKGGPKDPPGAAVDTKV